MRARARAGASAGLVASAFLAIAGGPVEGRQTEMNRLTEGERAEGWRLLFDGRTLDGWRGYMMEGMPPGWAVVDGALTRVTRARDIITTGKFGDFELLLDWKVDAGGNSGVFYRAIEGPDWIYHAAPEMQLLDDARHRDGASPLTSAGAVYALYPAPRDVARPAGEWNTARIVARGRHVEHWLNGVRVVQYEIGSDDWKQRVAASKFSEFPEFGQAKEGHIGLQEHGSGVAFRNIRIRELR